MPAVMPAQSAIAGIAAGQRTSRGEQDLCLRLRAATYATTYRLVSPCRDLCVVVLNRPHVERVRAKRADSSTAADAPVSVVMQGTLCSMATRASRDRRRTTRGRAAC